VTPPGAGLVLASRSPQRRAILETLGVAFTAVPSDVSERTTGDPREVAVENALSKARAVAASLEAGAGAGGAVYAPAAGVVLGVDTVVALGGRIYGKPPDAASARATLRALSGARHTVLSGIALVALGAGGEAQVGSAATEVQFVRLEDAVIDWYVDCGEWRERAGGYAIQGRGMALIERIDGDYSNVVGLPVAALLELWPGLLGAGAPLPRFCSDFRV
jgi:septum formation protein